MPPRWVLLTLLCAAVVVRARFMQWHLEVTDPDNYGTVAAQIYENGTFGIPTRYGVEPATATRPPLYPLALSSAYLFGFDAEGVARLLHVALALVTIWGTWRLGRLWSLPPGACLVAAALVTVDPILLAYSVQLMTETMAAALAVVALLAVTRAARDDSCVWALVAGLFGGLAILCRPEFLVWVVAVGVAFPLLAAPRRIARLACYLAAVAATLAPWGVRNYRLLGWPVVTTTHGGLTLLLANNPDFYEYLRSAPWGSAWDGHKVYTKFSKHRYATANYPPSGVFSRPMRFDELENDRWAYRQAFENIGAEPGMFLWSCVVRVGRLWGVLPHQTSPDESNSRRGMRYAVAIWYTFELVLAAIGAWFLRGKLFKNPWVWGTLLVLSITAVHAFYWTDMRMRAPLVGVVALACASGLVTLACGRGAPSRLARSV